MIDQFDEFTERARVVVRLAREEAQKLGQKSVGAEHLLLGLAREGEGLAEKVLVGMGIGLQALRDAVKATMSPGDVVVPGRDEIGLSSSARRAMESARDEAHRLGHRYIGTEHILLAVVGKAESRVVSLLTLLGVNSEQVRARVETAMRQAQAGSSPLGPQLQDLRQVIPIAQSKTTNGHTLTLLSLEDYADGFLLHTCLRSSHPRLSPQARVGGQTPSLVFDVRDDRGVEYTSRNRGGSPGGVGILNEWRATYLFIPAVNPAAHELSISVPELVWKGVVSQHDADSLHGRHRLIEAREKVAFFFAVLLNNGRKHLEG